MFFLRALVTAALIIFPMSAFAQSEASEMQGANRGMNPASTERSLETDRYFDTYKREELPASNKAFNDFVVGPGRFELEIAPGESRTVFLNISNRLGGGRVFQFTTEDMTSTDDGGDVNTRLLGDEVGPYTIKDYISVPYEKFYLENNQRAVVPVTISIPADAEPGGFYGSILTEVLPERSADGDSEVAPTAPIINRIGTLFFVTTPGDIERDASLIDFTTIPDKSFYFEGPIKMGLVYENRGSVHVTPRGKVTVTNILGDPVGELELSPWFVMPQSIRTREFTWDREFLFGRYTVTAEIERGYDDQVDTASVTFWVFPWKIITVVFFTIFTFFLLLRFLVRNFEFKRKT